MTQQPYPQQYPGQAQPYAQSQVQYPPQQQAYPQQFPVQQPYAPQQAYGQPPAQPQVPLANGSIDDFFNQPGAGTGPSLSWKDKPIGTAYAGIVARDVNTGDIQQETDPTTGAPKFFKDGRPKFVMKVPLKVQPSQEFPEGEATFYVRGQGRDELVRAMTESGCTSNVPKGGDALQVTLVQRRPSKMGNPANIVQIAYTVGASHGQAAQPAQPVQQAPVQYDPQAQMPQQPVPQQPVYQTPAAAPVQEVAPQVQQAPVQPVQQAPVQPAPQVGGLDPEQQALLAKLTGQAAPGTGAPAA